MLVNTALSADSRQWGYLLENKFEGEQARMRKYFYKLVTNGALFK